jgi:hypothetical protein
MSDRLLDVELGRVVRIEFVGEKLCNGSTVLVTLGPQIVFDPQHQFDGFEPYTDKEIKEIEAEE